LPGFVEAAVSSRQFKNGRVALSKVFTLGGWHNRLYKKKQLQRFVPVGVPGFVGAN